MNEEDEQIDDVKEEDVTEPTEVVSEEITEEPTVEPTKQPKSDPSISEAVCSVCGETVTPKVIDTERGVRYSCPVCKKFMRPLSPDEVQSRKQIAEETYDDADVLLPPEVIMVNIVKAMLDDSLPNIYGIPKTNKRAVVKAVTDTITSETIRDPRILHAHIKGFAKNINDQHLESLVGTIYAKLNEQGYGRADDSYIPRYGSIGPQFGERSPGGYGRLRQDMGLSDPRGEGATEAGPVMVMMIGGMPVKTRDPAVYLAYKRSLQDDEDSARKKEKHELDMLKLKADMAKGSSGSGDLIEIPNPSGEGTIKIPIHLAPFYMKKDDGDKEHRAELAAERALTEKARDETHAAQNERLLEVIDNLASRPSLTEEMQNARQLGAVMGMQTGGRTTIDLFGDGMKAWDFRLGQILDRMPIEAPAEGFQPQVDRTPSERQKKADEIMQNIDQSEVIHGSENALIEAVRKERDSREQQD